MQMQMQMQIQCQYQVKSGQSDVKKRVKRRKEDETRGKPLMTHNLAPVYVVSSHAALGLLIKILAVND